MLQYTETNLAINNTVPTNVPAGVTNVYKKPSSGATGSYGGGATGSYATPAPAPKQTVAPATKSATSPVSGVIPVRQAYTPDAPAQKSSITGPAFSGLTSIPNPVTPFTPASTAAPSVVNPNFSGTGTTPTQQFNQPVTGLFGNIAQSLANRSYEGSPELISSANKLQESAAAAREIAQKSAAIQEGFGKEYANVGRMGANAESGYLTTGTTPVAMGNAGVIARNTAAQQSAIASGAQMALQGTGQQLTAQQQQANALNQAGGLYGQQQGFVQSGLSSAGSLTQPQLAGIGSQQYYDPTGGSSFGSGLPASAQTAINNYAQQVKNGQMTRADAESRISAYGIAGTNALNSALGAGFNTNVSNAQAGVVGQQEQTLQGYQSAYQQAKNLQSQAADLITSFGLNPNDINKVNSGLQAIALNTSSPQYKILANYMADVASRYAQILTPPGGSSTDTTRAIATGMLDATASGQSIIAVMNALDQQAQAVIAGVKTVGSQNSSGSSIQSSSGKTYTLPFNLN